jgi:tetratricopeptide (TPR) repeat protein
MIRTTTLARWLSAASLLVVLTHADAQALGSKEKSPEEKAAESEKKATAKYNDGVEKMNHAKELLAKGDKDKAVREFEQAAKRYKEALEYKPDFPEALNNLGYSLRLSGRYEEALANYGQALKLKPDFMEAHEYRARAYLALDSVALAKSEYVWLVENKHAEEAESLKVAIDAWVLARAEGKKVSVEKGGW